LTERRVTVIGLVLGLIVLAGLIAYAVDRSVEQATQRGKFREIRNVVEHILAFQSYVSGAESAQRGFLLTHDPQYLNTYDVAREKIPAALTFLEQTIEQDTFQQEHMTRLRLLTERKLAELRASLDMAQTNTEEAINFIRSNAGKLLMDDLERDLKAILDHEYELLRVADQQERQVAEEVFQAIIGATLLAMLVLGVGTYRVVRDSGARELIDQLRDQAKLLNLAPIMTRDMDGCILSWSKGYERLYGWTENEAIGKISHDLLQTCCSTSLDKTRATLLREGQWAGELTHTRRDGTTIPVAASWTLLKEGNRRPVAVVEVTTNISELRAAQTALAESEGRFRVLADNISQFAWVADEKGWIYWYNNRWFEYTGTTLSEMKGWGWMKVHHPDHVDRVVEKFARCLETGEAWEDTFPLRGRDGQYRWFLSRAIPIHNAQGKVLQWFGTNTDITSQYQTEQALIDQTTLTQSILDSLHVHIAVIDVQGMIVQVTAGWEHFSREHLIPSSVESFGTTVNYLDVVRSAAQSDEQARRALEGMEAVLSGRLEVFEQEYLSPSPSERCWYRMSVVPLNTSEGGAVISHHNITTCTIAEEAQAFLAAIVTSSPDAIITKSVDGMILTWNRGAEGLFGYTRDEIVGQRVNRLVPEELQEEELRLRHRALRGTSVEQFETTRLHKSGRLVEVSISMSPVLDETGVIIATAQTMRDITFRKQAELAMQASEERFRTLTTSIPQLVWSCRPDGACEYLSEQWFAYTGTTMEENLGYGWLSLIHPEDVSMVDRSWKEAVASGLPYSVEYRLRAGDGTYRWQLARATPQRKPDGGIVQWFGTTTDISSQKDTESTLEQINSLLESKSEALSAANKELEAFSYSVSHDLRAPLRTMTGFAQALIEDYGTTLEPEAVRFLTTISNGARQMGRLIDDLLSFSRLSRQGLVMRPISIAELVKEIRDELAADQADRTVDWDVADLPTCLGNRTTIKLVLANLLGNALKYTRPRNVATIQIGWQRDEQDPKFYRIFVKDNGVGFDMRYADKLFTVFQRLHRAEAFEGTGVGLAIVQRIVHRHRGRVWAEGRPNEGATFWFTLEMTT
jgi:PAS domain S-box-containing protein